VSVFWLTYSSSLLMCHSLTFSLPKVRHPLLPLDISAPLTDISTLPHRLPCLSEVATVSLAARSPPLAAIKSTRATILRHFPTGTFFGLYLGSTRPLVVR
jgi:hypothetical protein